MDEHDPENDTPSEREQAEAEALAHALERGSGDDLPQDALEAAALLRYSSGEDESDGARMDAILEGVLDGAKAPSAAEPEPASWLSWLKWLVPVGALAAAGAFLLMVSTPGATPTATRVPAPDAELLSAQARVASRDEGAEGALASAMGDYRGVVLGSLSARYGR